MSKRGNSGFVDIDKRFGDGTLTGDTKGIVEVRQHYLERRQNRLRPLVDPFLLFADDFSTGDFNGGIVGPNNIVNSSWTVRNDTALTTGSNTNDWIVGSTTANDIKEGQTTGGGEGGNNMGATTAGTTTAAFISYNGTNNYYESAAAGAGTTNSHIFFDFHIPSAAVSLTLTFNFLVYGERSTSATAYGNYDLGYITFADPSTAPAGFPVAGTEYDTAAGTGYERLQTSDLNSDDGGRFTADDSTSARGYTGSGAGNSSKDTWWPEQITIDSGDNEWCTNCTRRLVFSWTCDTSIIDNPTFTITDLKLIYNT